MPPTTNSFLAPVSERISNITLFLLDSFLSIFGLSIDEIIMNSLGQSILAFIFLLPLTAALVTLVRRLLKRYLSHHKKEKNSILNIIVSALIRPLAFTIWIYGGFVAATPLLTFLSSALLFSAVEIVISGATFISLAWFLNIFIRCSAGNLQTLMNRNNYDWGDLLVPLIVKTLRVIVPLLAAVMFFEIMPTAEALQTMVRRLSSIFIIVSVFWALTQLVLSFDGIILKKFSINESDNLKARKIYTQVAVIQRIGLVVIGFLSFASILLLFPSVRQFGQTILASAGVAGIIMGFAMQKTLSNLFAGIQIAFTQPIRMDDVVIVENEWGWIEEITLTYVVVKIWDWRRLVLPISYFIERPFQNWTRTSASIMGRILMYADYRIDVPDLRIAMEKEVKDHPLWDGRVYCLQVTECRERTVELRILVSAVDSPKAWDLRCDIREAMLSYVQKNHPESLPQIRIGPQQPPHGREIEPLGRTTSQDEGSQHLDLEKTAAAE
ncbi:mechanosensitive ion channel MscS [Chitinispirillum alkaliphilum]|nr:mechanosensitive ion channel MscS [Chitinispirillum alkaliphilum]